MLSSAFSDQVGQGRGLRGVSWAPPIGCSVPTDHTIPESYPETGQIRLGFRPEYEGGIEVAIPRSPRAAYSGDRRGGGSGSQPSIIHRRRLLVRLGAVGLRDAGVALHHCHVRVAEQLLQGEEVAVVAQIRDGEGVPEPVRIFVAPGNTVMRPRNTSSLPTLRSRHTPTTS